MIGPKREVPVVGLTGGVAAGKSWLANELQQRGATVIDADAIGHQVLRRPLVIRSLANSLGPQIVDSAGQIDREKLASLVFGSDEMSTLRRRLLEMTVHPAIQADVIRAMRRALRSPSVPMIVIDAPLLLEARWGRMCDHIVFVDAPRSVRQHRALRRGWSAEQFAARESAQMDVEQKRRAADFVLEFTEDDQRMREQIDQLWHRIVHEAASR
ncbi:MAG: dephospho-CoA kinase [Pirellulaceae bacterium]|nr:MAG: dephospho-CoA kinase [Pirellulaceae bacterium]